MINSTKYDRVQAEFVITKSQASGRYHFKAKYCKYLNYLNGTPEEIANHIGKHMAETMRGMEINNATEIKIRMSWK